MHPSLDQAMAESAERVAAVMHTLLPGLRPDAAGVLHTSPPEAPLWEAMRYGALGGGKRLRPFLVLESAKLFAVDLGQALRTAAAVEFVHCYSLIHDDLPAMDNSDLRRGKPTVHKQFDDAIAVLAGDGLLTYAFEVLADAETHPDAAVRCALVTALAQAAGPAGMVGGQMMDLVAERTPFDLAETTRLQRAKTGALFGFSARAGAILGQAAERDHQALTGYADAMGLAFQIADDLLDVEGTEAATGKPVGRDAAAGKATFVSLLGADAARRRATELADEAGRSLAPFGAAADNLKAVAQYVVNRQS